MRIFLFLILSLLVSGCGSSGSSYDYYDDSSYEDLAEEEEYSGPREVQLDDVDGEYGYGTDQDGESVEVYIEEWNDSESGYGTDGDGNEVEFSYY